MPRKILPKSHPSGQLIQSLLVDWRLGRKNRKEVAESAKVSPRTMTTYKQIAEREGLQAIPAKLPRGRPTVFTAKQEEQLAEWVVRRSSRFDCATMSELRRMAFLLAEENHIVHPFKFGKAGREWAQGFLRRNGLRIKIAEMISKDRAFGLTREIMTRFFDVLEETIGQYGIKPQHVYNMDEAGFKLVRETQLKVLAKAGRKHAYRIKVKERSPLVTMVAACNPLGNFIPPVFVMRQAHFDDSWNEGAPPGSIVLTSPKGWMVGATFDLWVRHFDAAVARDHEDWVLLIVDGHTSHLNKDARFYCLERKILILTLPPHTSHRVQPLDVAFFGPLKAYYVNALDEFINAHGDAAPHHIPRIVAQPFLQAATVRNAASAYRKTGIWNVTLGRPDRDAYSDDDFIASEG